MGNQRFEDASSGLGVRISIQSIDALNLVHGYWTGKVCFNMIASVRDFAQTLSDRGLAPKTYSLLIAISEAGQKRTTADLKLKALRSLAEDVERYGQGEGVVRSEFKAVKGMNKAERLMRFAWIGAVNWFRGHEDVPKDYPLFSGDETFKFTDGNDMLTATWVIESHWYSQCSLSLFPFDVQDLCAIFWIKAWETVKI